MVLCAGLRLRTRFTVSLHLPQFTGIIYGNFGKPPRVLVGIQIIIAVVAMERAQGAAQAELARSYGVSQSTISRLTVNYPFIFNPLSCLPCRAGA
jgi:hypothetical protein